MTKKKFLTTVEEMLALKDTDTKIYTESRKGYHQFIQGTLFYFDTDGSITLFSEIGIGKGYYNKYILVEEPVKEVTKKDIGKLCKFLGAFDPPSIGILAGFTDDKRPIKVGGNIYKKCYKLTPSEVAEITGYKVEE